MSNDAHLERCLSIDLYHNAKKSSSEGKQTAIGSLKKDDIQLKLKYQCDVQNTSLETLSCVVGSDVIPIF